MRETFVANRARETHDRRLARLQLARDICRAREHGLIATGQEERGDLLFTLGQARKLFFDSSAKIVELSPCARLYDISCYLAILLAKLAYFGLGQARRKR